MSSPASAAPAAPPPKNPPTRQYGVVVSFSGTYGWLRPSGADKDVFFHQSGIKAAPGAFRAVVPGQVVTFEITHGPKGPVAIGLEIEIKSQVLHNYPGVKY